MKLRTLISPLALAATLAFSGSAMAQTMIGGFEVSPGDLGRVQEQCAALAVAKTQSLAGDKAIAEGSADATINASADPAAVENLDMLMASLTFEQCEEAGMTPEIVAQAVAAGDVMLVASNPDVIAACAGIRARANDSLAGDKATTEMSTDESGQDNPLDPASKHAALIGALDAQACAAIGL